MQDVTKLTSDEIVKMPAAQRQKAILDLLSASCTLLGHVRLSFEVEEEELRANSDDEDNEDADEIGSVIELIDHAENYLDEAMTAVKDAGKAA